MFKFWVSLFIHEKSELLREAAKKVIFLIMAVPLRPYPLPPELKGSRNFSTNYKKMSQKSVFSYS